MKSKPIHRLCALALALLMLLPMVSVPTFAERKVTYGTQDFESFSAGQTLTKADGFSNVAPINKVVAENGNNFLRLPVACENTSSLKSGTTNCGQYFMLRHKAFSTTEKTSIKMNLRMHGVGGSAPNVGVWLQNVSYKDSNGVTQKRQWYRFFDVNLLTGELTFNSVTGTKTGASGLKSDVWNTVEVIFDPADGSFDIYINDVLYANCTAPVTGTEFAVPANVLMYAVCSSNVASNFTAISDLDDDYGNANYMDADDFIVSYNSRELVNVEAKNLLYVDVEGTKIFNNRFYVAAGTSYTPVYFQEADWAGIVSTETKSSVRISSPSGLRFATLLDTERLDDLIAMRDAGILKKVTFGTLIAPTDYLGTDGLTTEALTTAGKKYLQVEATYNDYFELDGDASTTHFVGSIVNLYETNVGRDFSGRGYVTVTLYSGQTVTLYSAVTHSANVKDVAARALADETQTWSESERSILSTFAAGNLPPLSEDAQQVHDLQGLHVLAIGDSLFGGHTLTRDQQWLGLLAEQCNWSLTNLGQNGWTVAYNPDAYADPSQVRASMYDHLMNDSSYQYGNTKYYNTGTATQSTAEDVDIIFLEGGWNDYGWGIPLGTVADTDGSTYLGALKCMTEKLLTDYPNATIVYVTAWHTSGTRSDGASRMDFIANGMKSLCSEVYADNDRVCLIDAGDPSVSGVQMSDATWFKTYAIDNPHLNAEGMKIMAKNMIAQIWSVLNPES